MLSRPQSSLLPTMFSSHPQLLLPQQSCFEVLREALLQSLRELINPSLKTHNLTTLFGGSVVMGFLQICAGVVLLQLSKSAKNVPDAEVFRGDLDQVRTVAEQEEPESEPKAGMTFPKRLIFPSSWT